MMPAGTPKEIVDRWLIESIKLVKQPEVRDRMIASGVAPVGSTQEEFAAYVRTEVAQWARVIKATGAKPD
ncbi:MAG: tripartite tricarboxylate transporter substrate-binding protein [Desulfuromonadales bacterium]